ncbi:MAG TPA: hypothetical protein VGJ18_06550 [Gemmatimonadaceae bacterium]
MHDQIDFPGERRAEGRGVVGQEVMPAPAPLDPWPNGKVEAKVPLPNRA